MSKIKTAYNINNGKIAIIRALHRLNYDEISKITGYSAGTIKSWFADPDKPGYRKAPDDAYKKLHVKYSMEVE
ncbi:hypothetical protein [Piscirickettsia salmonis]|uniref:hypothetical protein n=1 Tax=Piscirickettsia salmonis TaxID=1238 RepID=UPI0007C8F4EE|nr:hypothetical protein A0O36_00411 [Piscirickettsiaceae bacterium NZ-RLO1]